MAEVSELLDQLSNEFLTVHTRKEDIFWETKMGLGQDPQESQRRLSKAEIEVNHFIQDASRIKVLREMEPAVKSDDELKALRGWIHMFSANAIEDPAAQKLSEEIIELEGKLQSARG